MNAGLPVRPCTLPSNPLMEDVSSGDPANQDTVRSASASADLAAALGGRPPIESSDAEDVEPSEARTPRRAPSPEGPTDAEIEAHRLSGHACFQKSQLGCNSLVDRAVTCSHVGIHVFPKHQI